LQEWWFLEIGVHQKHFVSLLVERFFVKRMVKIAGIAAKHSNQFDL